MVNAPTPSRRPICLWDKNLLWECFKREEDGNDIDAADQTACEAAGGVWEVEPTAGTVSGNNSTVEFLNHTRCDCDDYDCDWDAIDDVEDEESCEAIEGDTYWVGAQCIAVILTDTGS